MNFICHLVFKSTFYVEKKQIYENSQWWIVFLNINFNFGLHWPGFSHGTICSSSVKAGWNTIWFCQILVPRKCRDGLWYFVADSDILLISSVFFSLFFIRYRHVTLLSTIQKLNELDLIKFTTCQWYDQRYVV
jgi:hypothetical protein